MRALVNGSGHTALVLLALVLHDRAEGGSESRRHVLDTERWGTGLVDHLLWRVWHVDETAPLAGELPIDHVQHLVHDVIADVSAGGIREHRWHSRSLHRGDHRLDRQRAEVGRWAVLTDGLVDRLVAVVVGDAAVVDVDGDSLGADREPPARLPDAHDRVGVVLHHGGAHNVANPVEDDRDLHLDDLALADSVRQSADGLPRWVEWLVLEGLETGDQYLHLSFPLFVVRQKTR